MAYHCIQFIQYVNKLHKLAFYSLPPHSKNILCIFCTVYLRTLITTSTEHLLPDLLLHLCGVLEQLAAAEGHVPLVKGNADSIQPESSRAVDSGHEIAWGGGHWHTCTHHTGSAAPSSSQDRWWCALHMWHVRQTISVSGMSHRENALKEKGTIVL